MPKKVEEKKELNVSSGENNSPETFGGEVEPKKTKKLTRQEGKNIKRDILLLSRIKKDFNKNFEEAMQIADENKKVIKPTSSLRVKEAKAEVEKKSSRVAIYFYILCMLINLVSFSVFLFLYSGSAVDFKQLFSRGAPSVIWFIGGILCFFATCSLEGLIVSLINKKSSSKFSYTLSYKSNAICRYYDSITPLKSGGQPFQINYLYKFGKRAHNASSVPVAKFIFGQITYLIAIVALLFSMNRVAVSIKGGLASFFSVIAYIGLAFQLIWLLIVMILSNSKKVGPSIVVGGLKFLHKLHIVKDYRATFIKVLRFVKDYQNTMRHILSNFFYFVLMIALSALTMLLKWAIPFFMYCTLYGFNFDMLLKIVALVMVCELALGFWILPGNVIFADLAFLALFRPIFGDGYIFWALLYWRVLYYYAYIIQGGIIKIYDDIKYNVLKKPIKKDEDLIKKVKN